MYDLRLKLKLNKETKNLYLTNSFDVLAGVSNDIEIAAQDILKNYAGKLLTSRILAQIVYDLSNKLSHKFNLKIKIEQ